MCKLCDIRVAEVVIFTGGHVDTEPIAIPACRPCGLLALEIETVLRVARITIDLETGA